MNVHQVWEHCNWEIIFIDDFCGQCKLDIYFLINYIFYLKGKKIDSQLKRNQPRVLFGSANYFFGLKYYWLVEETKE